MWYITMLIGSSWLLLFLIGTIKLKGQFWLLFHPFSWLALSKWLENHIILEKILTGLWIISIPCYIWLIVNGIRAKRARKKASQNNT